MKFTLTIESDNVSMDEENARDTVSDALRTVAKWVWDGHNGSNIRDFNGHKIGSWELRSTE